MCVYCKHGKRIDDEYDEGYLEITPLVPLPSVILSGEGAGKTLPAEEPYACLFFYYYGDSGESMSFPIKYCPMCGEELKVGGIGKFIFKAKESD